MKVVSFLIMSTTVMVTTLGQQATRLLRVPKVYNTLISTDEDLIPSVAYKAVSPVIKSVAPNPYFPFSPILNVVHQEEPPVLIPPQDSYRTRFEASPEASLYGNKDVYNDLVNSLHSLNYTSSGGLTGVQDSGAVPAISPEQQQPPAGGRRTPDGIVTDITNNRSRNPAIPDVPPPPLPVGKRNEKPAGKEYPPAPVGFI